MTVKAARAVVIVVLAGLAAVTTWLARSLSDPWPGPGGTIIVVVEKGQSVRSVAAGLQRQGVVPDARAVTLAYDAFYSRELLKAGEYEFTFPLRPKDALLKILRGRIYLHPVTIPEGLTTGEIGDLLRGRARGSFPAACLDTGLISDWDPTATDLEGYLFPDTYHVPAEASAADIVFGMVAQFRKVFTGEWRERAARLGMNVRQAVTLASLIEKETARPEERPLVSAVFHNRLRLGMKLDCDPTIIYALKLDGRYTGRLLSRDLAYPSPYNTYLHQGLPPGPICNPGRDSLEAALYPAAEDYLYFVAQSDGRHHFSRSFAEHQEAVRRYILKK
jgi:UPF0755 protein